MNVHKYYPRYIYIYTGCVSVCRHTPTTCVYTHNIDTPSAHPLLRITVYMCDIAVRQRIIVGKYILPLQLDRHVQVYIMPINVLLKLSHAC